ncbi:MAG: deoxyribodipyrimidine photolyase [Saprospiraceae bacterium]|nr:deoxyribodipyrimidine photolyase [Saprospiraceae bacterium]
MFPTDVEAIEQRISDIDPIRYGYSRNFADGAVTKLSPYISRGVVSTKVVFDHIRSLDLPFKKVEKLVQELAWRDYWQQVWIAKGDGINVDLKHKQEPVSNFEVPLPIMTHQTSIDVIDEAILDLYRTGYMHNHMRMYVASITCNIAQSHWLNPAQWMYAHLLDGDWASNALSWQWVAGTNAHKKYFANQQNINKYFYSNQSNTFLDVDYSYFGALPIPEHMQDTALFSLQTELPKNKKQHFQRGHKTLLYNYYNLDPYWHTDEDVQRILLLEPSFFDKYPVSPKCIGFMLELAQNISGIKIFVGKFQELAQKIGEESIVFKEHPTNAHYRGRSESRDWMFDVEGYYPSFFAFWKQCKKMLSKKGDIR